MAHQSIAEIISFQRRTLPVVPSLRDIVPGEHVIPHAYGELIEASSDLMDFAMKHANEEEAATIFHLAEAMRDRMAVLAELAKTRLKQFQKEQ